MATYINASNPPKKKKKKSGSGSGKKRMTKKKVLPANQKNKKPWTSN